MDCPEDLVYHKNLEFCDWRHNVFECGEEGEENEFSGDGSGESSGDEEITFGDSSGESSGDELLENVCESLKDGVYSSGTCSSSYIICNSGSPRFLSCSTPLIYDPTNKKCSWKGMIDECSQVSGEYCESDGNISKSECSNVFFSCSEGIAHRRNCPANLVFNPAISSCDWPKNVMDCSEKSEKPQNCGEVDGYFSFGRCSSSFSACTNGIPIVMFCPDGLMFSEKNQMCDYEWNVDECDLESSGFMENYKASEALTPCTNMDNGLYALDCTPRVLSCQNGRENIFECPPSLVFNENSLICDYPETSLKCCMEDALLIRDASIGTYDCSIDGLFSSTLCSRNYHKCSNGQLIPHECADSNAVFSASAAKCVDSSLLEQCQ